MLLEALVIGACLQGEGCNESYGAYYKQSTQLQSVYKNVSETGKKIVRNNEYVLYIATPLYTIASGKTAGIKLYKGLMLNLNVKDQFVGLGWTF